MHLHAKVKALVHFPQNCKECSYRPYTLQLFSQLQRYFQQFFIWATIFLTDFFQKIFAVLCVVCKGLKDVMLCILNLVVYQSTTQKKLNDHVGRHIPVHTFLTNHVGERTEMYRILQSAEIGKTQLPTWSNKCNQNFQCHHYQIRKIIISLQRDLRGW